MSFPLDRFIPSPEIRERHEVVIHAPAGLVFEVAKGFDMQSLPLVRAILWLRARTLGARLPGARPARGLVAETLGLGWGRLEEIPGRRYIAGATCRPWEADVVFRAVPADRFAGYREPNQVKIAWTLEATPLGPSVTRFASETRAVSTDAEAGKHFRRYYRVVRFGILAIRRLMLPALRREAEARWQRSQRPTAVV